ncbi:MAG: glucoamylase family protein [Fimbriimonas sp.]
MAAIAFGAPLTGTALLNELQLRAFRFFWNESHPITGLTKDRAANFQTSDTFTVASCASTGFALAAYPIGVERKWCTREEARERTRRTLRTMLNQHEHYKGWFAHFTDWSKGTREWKCEFSTIDTSIFLAGMIVAKEYWKDPEVNELSDKILARLDWDAMLTSGGSNPTSLFICHGYRPEEGYLKGHWADYSEEKMLFLQAYGANPKWTNEGWMKHGKTLVDYKGLKLIRGGPLFIHQMAESFYDFKNMRDPLGYDYWIATRNATLANRQYAIDNPQKFAGYGPNFWGLSACDGPDGYNAFGAPGWISDNGTITPTSGIAGINHTPKESLALAESLVKEHPEAWGRYGFSNGINPHRKWRGPDVIGIDLGMMMMAIENYRTGMIHRLSRSNPLIQRGYAKVGFVKSVSNARAPLHTQP